MGKTKPALKLLIAYQPVKALVPYAKNARTHSVEQVNQLARSIKKFGFTNPVLVDGKRGIIAGHGRVLAAEQVGMAEVPTIELATMSEADKRAYIIADNKLALNAGWDHALLAIEMAELQALDVDLSLTGFSDAEVAALVDPPAGLTDAEDAPDVPKNPAVALGQIWHLGVHRLLVGDCTKAETVKRLLGDQKPALMVTDPPYGVNYNPAWRNEAYRAGPMRRTKDAKAVGKLSNDNREDWSEAWALFPGDVAYVWQGDKQISGMEMQLTAAGFLPRNLIVWNKSTAVISRGDYHPKHETCWYMVRKGKPGHWSGTRKQTTVWDIERPHRSDTGHSTQKPVECMRRPILNNSRRGQVVYDPFCGSFTTGIACEMEKRLCYAIEIDPAYAEMSIERWQNFTGKIAKTEGGLTLADLRTKRNGLDRKAPLSATLAAHRGKASKHGNTASDLAGKSAPRDRKHATQWEKVGQALAGRAQHRPKADGEGPRTKLSNA